MERGVRRVVPSRRRELYAPVRRASSGLPLGSDPRARPYHPSATTGCYRLAPAVPPSDVPFREALRVWIRVAATSFGGPAGQIAVMHRIVVEEKRWVSEARFLHALNFCMLLPGPEAQQLATYLGWLLHGTKGGLVAGTLFVLPGFLSILALSFLYVLSRNLPAIEGLFFGLKAAVLAVVVDALLRIGRRALVRRLHVAIAAAAFAAIFALRVPFPAIVLGAGALGLLARRALVATAETAAPIDADAVTRAPAAPSLARAARIAAVGLALWAAPVAACIALAPASGAPPFADLAVFFSKMAVVTFGGAYAVLAYVAQHAVEVRHWLQPGEMLDGLGMAETTPGPLIQVVQFVGFLAAHRAPGSLPPLAAGALASVLVTWVTFVPCFLWIFLGAPWIEALRGNRRLAGALSAITAAVVGVILNLALWFALHVLFRSVADAEWLGVVRVPLPVPRTVDLAALALAALSALALLRFRLGMIATLAASAALGVALRLLGLA